MRIWVYDLEVLGGNFFSGTFIDPKTLEMVQIYKLDDKSYNLDKLDYFLNDAFLVGYNNKVYDDAILNKIRKEGVDTEEIYNLSQALINSQKSGIPIWKHPDILPYLRYGVKSLDLMKILAFDKLKVGLKQCAVNLRHPVIQDLPFKYDYKPTIEDITMILSYNKNDVDITIRLFKKIIEDVILRMNYSTEYKVDVLNASRTYIGKKTLDKMYSEHTGMDLEEFNQKRTYRGAMKMSDCILNQVKFTTPDMQKMLDFFKGYSITNIENAIDYLVLFKNKGYQMGFGGLHSVDRPAIYNSTDDLFIMDADVDSYYPKVMLEYKIKPEHVTDEFFDVLQNITDKRIKAKREKDKVTNETLKITINSMFGLLNFPNYWLYDSKAALAVTINGQMFLLMLIEALEENRFEVISANTDGVTALVPKNRMDEYKAICNKWEKNLGFTFSYTKYNTYVRRDVNNYVAEPEDADLKQKGCFLEKQKLDKGYNTSIIPRALNNYFLYGTPVEETVKGGKDIFDYCLSEKTGSQFTMEFHHIQDNEKKIDVLQKTNRFFISVNGGTLIKRKEDDSLHNVALGWTTTILNRYDSMKLKEYLSNIDYRYYITETNKIIEQIETKQLTLDIWK